MGANSPTPTREEIQADYDRWQAGADVDTAGRVARYVPYLLQRVRDLELAYADGLEQRRLALLPDSEREVHFSELEQHITDLERQLAEAAREINCAGPVAHRIRVLKQEWSEQQRKVEAQRDATLARLRDTLVTWTHTYAPEFCEESKVEEVRKRIKTAGGVIAYIADMNEWLHEQSPTLTDGLESDAAKGEG
jgi:vacuolar-type H+-ATPase subunit I/STV1